MLLSKRGWPTRGYVAVATLAIIFGASYTIISEWLKTEVRHNWTYSNLMPRLPFIGTGMSPLLQWVLHISVLVGETGSDEPRVASSYFGYLNRQPGASIHLERDSLVSGGLAL